MRLKKIREEEKKRRMDLGFLLSPSHCSCGSGSCEESVVCVFLLNICRYCGTLYIPQANGLRGLTNHHQLSWVVKH